jgi:chromosome segregation ATPase
VSAKKASSKKSSKKTSKKKSTSAKSSLPIPPAPRKAGAVTKERSYINLGVDEKAEIAARNLLRLYQFLQMDKPISELKLIQELEMDTPNEELRNEIMQLKLEIESLHEENHALQQTALRTQVEAEEQIEAIQFQNQALKTKIKDMNEVIQEEIDKRAVEYEAIIGDLRNKLKQSIAQHEKYTEVTEGIKQLQAQVTELFDQNEALNGKNNDLKKKITQLEESAEEREQFIQGLEKKNKELEKKTELQNMVIDGYKRKERQESS